ncbi:MAG TPA: hypothetical protein VKE94_08825 [Gemmataceae bacterium]|nr:hypothetical protein [Gemmataceae bacterium]
MRRWQLTGLVLGATALFITARPAQAQVWIGAPPVVVTPAPVVVAPTWGVAPAWGARPYWGWRRGWYAPRRGWYGGVRGPRGGVVVAGRRW